MVRQREGTDVTFPIGQGSTGSLFVPVHVTETAYQKAGIGPVAARAKTEGLVQSGSRTVVTTMSHGSLLLRYAPQEPRPERSNTSS